MPRKAPVPQSEVEIGNRLSLIRRRIHYPRRLFAKIAGIDTAVITRIELGRAPLKYGIAAKILSAFSVNPVWLAFGEGGPIPGVALPPSSSLGVEDSALFSDVFGEKLAERIRRRIAKLEDDPRYRYGESQHPTNAKGRVIAEEFLIADIREWVERVPSNKLNSLVNEIRFAAMRLLDDWESPSDSPDVIERRRVRMNSVREWLRKRRDALYGHHAPEKKHLTNTASSSIPGAVKNQWPAVKRSLQRATAAPGAKSRLAKFLKVDLTRVSQWLTDAKSAREPGAEYALQMLYWVEHPELQK